MTATGWTLDELTARVAAALDGTAYAGAPNGRVRDVPDARAIRWYATIGLVDRPAMRGRTALYGPRHLAQLVAIKRRQSEGRRIADIQIELAEAPDAVLWEIADLPWHEQTRPGPRGASAARFWAEPPAPHTSPPTPSTPPTPSAPSAPPTPPTDLLSGVPLGADVTLLLPGAPGPEDVAAIRAAAQPLLDLLAARGLTARDPSPERGSVP